MERSEKDRKTPVTTRTVPEVQEQLAEEEVRRRAYEIYQRRGAVAGNEVEDWLEAEAELRGSERSNEAA